MIYIILWSLLYDFRHFKTNSSWFLEFFHKKAIFLSLSYLISNHFLIKSFFLLRFMRQFLLKLILWIIESTKIFRCDYLWNYLIVTKVFEYQTTENLYFYQNIKSPHHIPNSFLSFLFVDIIYEYRYKL